MPHPGPRYRLTAHSDQFMSRVRHGKPLLEETDERNLNDSHHANFTEKIHAHTSNDRNAHLSGARV